MGSGKRSTLRSDGPFRTYLHHHDWEIGPLRAIIGLGLRSHPIEEKNEQGYPISRVLGLGSEERFESTLDQTTLPPKKGKKAILYEKKARPHLETSRNVGGRREGDHDNLRQFGASASNHESSVYFGVL